MKRNHWKPGQKIAAGLQGLMALIYLGSGAFLFGSEKAGTILPALPSGMVPWIAGALLIYGLFRAYRAYNQIRKRGIRSL